MSEIPWFTKVCLEVNSDCNRACWFCNRHGDSRNRFIDEQGQRIKRLMSMEQIENIAKQLVDMNWNGLMLFGHMSEPTLDNRIVDIATMFKKCGFPIMFHTNGDTLRKDEDMCRALSEVVNHFVVGIYDLTDEQEIAKLQNWWRHRLAPSSSFSVATTRFQRRFSLQDDSKNMYPNSPCGACHTNLVIYYDGEVALCCEDINCEFNLGNTFETSIHDIWTSPHHIELVKKISKRRKHHPICAVCPIVPRG